MIKHLLLVFFIFLVKLNGSTISLIISEDLINNYLDTKFTCNKRCLLEYAIMKHNYNIVKILLSYNCNII